MKLCSVLLRVTAETAANYCSFKLRLGDRFSATIDGSPVYTLRYRFNLRVEAAFSATESSKRG